MFRIFWQERFSDVRMSWMHSSLLSMVTMKT